MKKFLVLFLLMVSGAVFASPVEVDYADGVYHIVLSGDKIKKQIEKLYSRMQKEKQFNIKVEINKKITELKKELDNLNE